jgi:hypothetical protein
MPPVTTRRKRKRSESGWSEAATNTCRPDGPGNGSRSEVGKRGDNNKMMEDKMISVLEDDIILCESFCFKKVYKVQD